MTLPTSHGGGARRHVQACRNLLQIVLDLQQTSPKVFTTHFQSLNGSPFHSQVTTFQDLRGWLAFAAACSIPWS